MNKIGKVIIFGGTHGNELSGVFLVNKWMKNDEDLKMRLSACPVQTLIANPEAVRLCRRYKDCDLNRQFSEENYSLVRNGSNELPYEIKRASELNDMIRNCLAFEKPQVILDLHNTTANMGCTFIAQNTTNSFSMHMAAYAQTKMKEDGFGCEVLVLGQLSYPSTKSLTECGLGIEVGPQPQGVLRADILKIQEKAVFHCLEFVDKLNKGHKFPAVLVKTFSLLQRVGFPGPSFEAVIHENVQDKDFQPISSDDPVFRRMNNEVLRLKDVVKPDVLKETVYPIFVNEAAYYEKDLAFWLVNVTNVELSNLEVKR